jgi:lactate dehydrogenase-like 2-hydroxyacid dehydrogenase
LTATLCIGPYPDTERAALQADFAPLFARSLAEALALPAEVRARVAALAYRSGQALDGAAMAAFPALRLVANYGVGYDAIDVAAARARGIAVTNTPDVLSDDVADLAVALLLMQGRRLVQGDALVRSGRWAAGEGFALNRKISGGRAGILGLGRIGREIANRLAAFRMDIHYWSRHEKDTPGWTWHADPVSLAGAVDYLIVALVGGKETAGMVSAEVLEALGPRGILINIARGSVVDEPALLDALEQGRIAGAGLDVFWNEPQVNPRFLALDTVVLQPHQGSGTVETRAAMAALQRGNIAALHAGRPLPTPVP